MGAAAGAHAYTAHTQTHTYTYTYTYTHTQKHSQQQMYDGPDTAPSPALLTLGSLKTSTRSGLGSVSDPSIDDDDTLRLSRSSLGRCVSERKSK